MAWRSTATRNTVIGVSVAVMLSTLGMQASDYMQHGTSSFLASVSSGDGECPEHTVPYQIDGSRLCVDAYEASAGAACPHSVPRSGAASTENVQASECYAVSAPAVPPLRYVTYTHAEQLCAQAGKRLPTPREWHTIARELSMTDAVCVTAAPGQQAQLTGSAQCVNDGGVHDLVGNVWEWVDAEVVDGQYQGRAVPREGYVGSVDTSGVVLETTDEPDPLYDGSYAWTREHGVHGMVRGGFYGSGDDAGRYTQNLSVPLDMATAGIGFRCVMDRV